MQSVEKNGQRLANRSEIEASLESRPFFQRSSPEVQRLLLSLSGDLTPEEVAAKKPDQSCNGYLADLAVRPEVGGGVRCLSIDEVLIPRGRVYGIFTNFKVVKCGTEGTPKPVVFAYQYFSWRQGPQSGAKGLVLIEDKGSKLTHAVVLSAYSFAPAMDTMDITGGFAELNEKGVKGMLVRFETEVREELGVPSLNIKRIIDLGSYHPDRGMTNNRPNLFAAVINASEATRIPVGQWKNPDPYEMRSVPNIVPISDFWGEKGVVEWTTDGYFLACVARLVNRGVLVPVVG